jgi:low temperature requirement protein LtrA
MQFFQKPIVRQYFHKGLLWRAREAQEVASYELFIDLFYVAIIAITGDNAAENATGESLLHFIITFVLGWKFWSDLSTLISWFDSDDILRRFSVLFILTCLLGYTTNMAAAWEETYTAMISFYLAARLFIAVTLFWYAYQIPIVRASMIGNATMTILPAALWIGSIHVEEPTRQALIWPALTLDILGYGVLLLFQRGGSWASTQFSAWSARVFEFYPGTNIEHKIERTNAFVTLVFGYSVVGLLFQSSVPFGLNAFFGKAVLALIQAFSFNWLYFEIDSFNLHTHAIRRHVFSAIIWFSVHLPFIMSFVLSASSLTKLVLAHDCADADPHALWETYERRSEEHISVGQRWFYCTGLGVALACMGVIARTHVYRAIPKQRLGKNKRLGLRLLVAFVIVLLPLAGDRLNSLQLIATTCGLVVFVLGTELFGNSCVDEAFWWGCEEGRKKCTYDAKCDGITREELRECVRKGTVVEVESIARKGTGREKGGGMGFA